MNTTSALSVDTDVLEDFVRWQWEHLCGPDGLKIWSPDTHDLGICFQELCLHIPALVILAVVSAYYFGNQLHNVSRGLIQHRAVNLRCVIVTLLTLAPILQVYIVLINDDVDKFPIFYFLSAVQGLTWVTHLGYTLTLRNKICLSARGPVFVCFVWTIIAVLNVIMMRSRSLIYRAADNPNYGLSLCYGFSILTVILHVLYALTLIPNDGDTVYVQHQRLRPNESQPLLSGNAYHRFLEERDPNYLGVAMEDATWLSKLFFCWVNPLMRKGLEEKLGNADDLFDLPDSLRSDTLSRKLERVLIGRVDDTHRRRRQPISRSYGYESLSPSGTNSFESVQDVDVCVLDPGRRNVSLLRALHRCFGVQFYAIGLLKLTADSAGFAGPMLLNGLVSFMEDKSGDIRYGYAYAAGLFAMTLIGAFFNTHFNFFMAMVGLKIRAALVTTIYKKTLSVSVTVLNAAFSTGEIVNFMSTDTDRVVNSCPSFHALWSIPFQIAFALFLLYNQVGLAFLAGVGFTVVLIPINKLIANKIGEFSTKMMDQKDKRVKIMTEILRGVKSIKLHVWEDHFMRVVIKFRDSEVKYLKLRKYLDALCVYFWATTPVLISIFTFVTYIALGNRLTAATVFTTIALLNMLIAPLNTFPWVLNGITEAWVSLKRIQKLLDLPDLDLNSYYDRSTIQDNANLDIVIKQGEFSWNKALTPEEKQKLHAIKQKVHKDTGIGKRSKNNSESSPEEVGEQVQEFCLNDINFSVKKGEFVGIIGMVGSGKSSMFSAIMAELTKREGRIGISNQNSGFALITQQPWLQRGTIKENILFGKGYDENKYVEVLTACCLTEDLEQLPGGDLTGVGEGGMTLSGGQKARVALARAIYQDKDIYLLDDIISAVDATVARQIFQNCLLGILRHKTRILCTHHVQYLMYADRIIVMENGTIQEQGKACDVLRSIDDSLPVDLELNESISTLEAYDSIRLEDSTSNDSILNEEARETGTVHLNVYFSYWKAIGHFLSITIVLAIITMQFSRNLADWWLAYWVSDSESGNSTNLSAVAESSFFSAENDQLHGEKNLRYYMTIYIILACLNSVFTLFRAFLFAFGGITAASTIHKSLLKSIMKAKVAFFDISPLGRVLNRFSSDTYTVDDSLPFILNILSAQFFGLVGSVVITIYGLPWLCVILVPLIPVYHWLQNSYRLTTRELKRLSSVTLSPIYSHFNESLQGLPIIRAFRTVARFKRDNEQHVEENQKTQLASQAASQWLGLRLQFIGVAMVTGVVLIAVIQHQFDVAEPGLVGLAITYALSITGLLNGVVNAFTETEREMIAVERINQYIEEVQPESGTLVVDPPYGWPSQGVIAFDNVSLNYREHLAPSLKNVSFKTRPAEKIGIVGRTGAGKSSLFSALFRLCDISAGTITIDSVKISSISLTALRSRLSCIPQDPFLFSGTIRDNLDPLNQYREPEIWSAVNNANLISTVRRMGGLDAEVTAGGANFSSGQKQLLCLARALLHNAKILCIDEATADIDQATDRQIQCTLRSAFRKSTVITIAHRVETVLDYDRVLVMGDGDVLEFDKPDILLDDTSSHFYRLVHNE